MGFLPNNYTREAASGYSIELTELASHLNGTDQLLTTILSRLDALEVQET